MVTRIALLTACLLPAACVSPSSAPPPQPQVQAPKPVVAPAGSVPAPQRPIGEWVDWPIEPGAWVYRNDDRGSLALFGPANADATVKLRCDKPGGRVVLSVAGSGSQSFTIRTSSTMKSLAATAGAGAPPYLTAEIMSGDPILDAMVFSRGRFAIEVGGLGAMAIPNWAEVARVVEDCRG